MDITGMNDQRELEWPSDETQMARIRAGALGHTLNERVPEQPVQQFNQPVINEAPSVTTEELSRLKAIDNMLKTGELQAVTHQNDTQVQSPQIESQPAPQDQGGQTDWMSQFDDAFNQDDQVSTQPATTTAQPNGIDTASVNREVGQAQNESATESEVALINEGAKLGVARNSMIEFARGLTTEDYMELYKYKQSKTASTNTPVQPPSQTQGYQPRNFTRTKPSQGPSVANLNGAPTQPTAGNGIPRLYGTGAMNYNI